MSDLLNDIGIIPKDADLIPLKNCIRLIIDNRGKTPKKLGSDWSREGIKVISAKNVHNGTLSNRDEIRFVTHDIYEKWMKVDVERGDCLLASEGATLGENLYWDFDFPVVLGQRLFCIRTNPNILDPKYFYAFVTTNLFQGQIEGRTSGTSVFGLRQTELLKLLVPIIPMDRQKIIGDVHYSINKKIGLLRSTNKTLEKLVGTLFRKWFDIECDDANLLGYLGDYFIDTIGGDWGKDKPDEQFTIEVKCIRGTDIGNLESSIPNPPVRFVKESKYMKCRLLNGDIVIEISGGTEDQSTGRSHFFDQNALDLFGGKVVFSNFCRLLRPKSINYTYFLHLYLNAIYNRGDFFNLENGTSGIKNLDLKSFLYQEKYLQPEESRIIAFNKAVKPFFSKSTANLLQIQKLEILRDTLLPKLMSGAVNLNNLAL